MTEGFNGGCLCGAVRYRVDGPPALVAHCYCEDCRRSSGTSHCTHAMTSAAALEITGIPKFHERTTDSGNLVSRGFCGVCGSAVYSTNSAMPGMAFVRVSSMDEPDHATPTMTVYASRAPSWALLDRSHPVFEEMPQGGPESVIPKL